MTALKQAIKEKARQLGFSLAGVTSCEPPAHYNIFEEWLEQNKHGTMQYLAEERSRIRRADPKQILPECKSILVLALPYANSEFRIRNSEFQIAAYALGDDYHDIIPTRLKQMVEFIEEQVGHPIPNRYYTDTGPILERELAQRAGLGWVGKNSMLINPQAGSTFFLAEILLGIELEPDAPFATDHCGTCTRCLTACPTQCIQTNRTIDARRCISYLTIELKEEIPEDLRPQMENWIFGCDICQQACPWNRFSLPADSAFETKIPLPVLTSDLTLSSVEFNQRFKKSPIKRTKRRGYLRNLSIAVGNKGDEKDIPILEQAAQDDEPLIKSHAQWAIRKITKSQKKEPAKNMNKLLIATNNKGKVKELQELLKDTGLQLVTPADINLSLEVVEDGKDYAENASKKAIAFATTSGLISLADDSGLEVDALGGAPGLYSARYSPKPGANDADRRAFLLQNVKDKPRPWKAHFHATIAIAKPSGEVEIVEGNCFGEIIPEERGNSGFGYDPIFYIPELNQTMAELGMEQKNRLSHRGLAAANAIPVLKKLFGG